MWRVLKQTYLVRAVDELGNMYERETESVQQMCFWETSPALLKLKIYKKKIEESNGNNDNPGIVRVFISSEPS